MEETKKEFTPRPERAERPQRGRRRRKVCAFCVDKVAHVDSGHADSQLSWWF